MPRRPQPEQGVQLKTPLNSPRSASGLASGHEPNRHPNGTRPHGGYRGVNNYTLEKRGTSEHPPTMFSMLATPDEMQQTEKLQSESIRPCSPGWAINVAEQKNHSGESQLFVNKLLSPSKVKAPQDDEGHHVLQQVLKKTRPMSCKYYRPNSLHQYLAHTDLKDAAKHNVNPKLGRPTRTTLLRARQRCGSAPMYNYNDRQERACEMSKRVNAKTSEKQTENYHNKEVLLDRTGLTVKDLIGSHSSSLHGYLIGARYNRAHCLDIKSYAELGLYMPRGQPNVCFMAKRDPKSRHEQSRTIDSPRSTITPAPPPDTPLSIDEVVQDEVPAPHTAWTDPPQPSPTSFDSDRHEAFLNIKGTAYTSPHTKTQQRLRNARTQSLPTPKVPKSMTAAAAHSQRATSLPAVRVDGSKAGFTPRSFDPNIERTEQANIPLSIPRPSLDLSSADAPPSSPSPAYQGSLNVDVMEQIVEGGSTGFVAEEAREAAVVRTAEAVVKAAVTAGMQSAAAAGVVKAAVEAGARTTAAAVVVKTAMESGARTVASEGVVRAAVSGAERVVRAEGAERVVDGSKRTGRKARFGDPDSEVVALDLSVIGRKADLGGESRRSPVSPVLDVVHESSGEAILEDMENEEEGGEVSNVNNANVSVSLPDSNRNPQSEKQEEVDDPVSITCDANVNQGLDNDNDDNDNDDDVDVDNDNNNAISVGDRNTDSEHDTTSQNIQSESHNARINSEMNDPDVDASYSDTTVENSVQNQWGDYDSTEPVSSNRNNNQPSENLEEISERETTENEVDFEEQGVRERARSAKSSRGSSARRVRFSDNLTDTTDVTTEFFVTEKQGGKDMTDDEERS